MFTNYFEWLDMYVRMNPTLSPTSKWQTHPTQLNFFLIYLVCVFFITIRLTTINTIDFSLNCCHASTKPYDFVSSDFTFLLKIMNMKFNKKTTRFCYLTNIAIEKEDCGDCYGSHDAAKITPEVVGPD